MSDWLQKSCSPSVLLFCARNPSLSGARNPWNRSSAAWWHDTPSQCPPSSSWTWSVGMRRWTRRRRCPWSTSRRVSCTTSSAFRVGWWRMAGIKVGGAASSSLWASGSTGRTSDALVAPFSWVVQSFQHLKILLFFVVRLKQWFVGWTEWVV